MHNTKIIQGLTLTLIDQSPVSYDFKYLLELAFNGIAIGTILIPIEDWENVDKLTIMVRMVISCMLAGHTEFILNVDASLLMETAHKGAYIHTDNYYVQITDKDRFIILFTQNIIAEVTAGPAPNGLTVMVYESLEDMILLPIGILLCSKEEFESDDYLQNEVAKVKNAKDQKTGYEFSYEGERNYLLFDDKGFSISTDGGMTKRVEFLFNGETGGENA